MNRLEELVLGYIEGTLSESERAELLEICRRDEEALTYLSEELEAAAVIRETVGGSDARTMRERVLASLRELERVREPQKLRESVLRGVAGLRPVPGRRSRRAAGLRARRRPGRRTVFSLLLAGLAAAVLLGVFLRLRSEPDGARRVVAFAGSVEGPAPFVDGEKDSRKLILGAPVHAGERLRTGDGRVRLDCASGTRLFMNRGTNLGLTGRVSVTLTKGQIYVDTAPEDCGFAVETPEGRAVDLGTRFGVETEIGKGTTVVVAEGKVEASTDVGRAEVETGQEVLLARLGSPLGPVREAEDIDRRFAWAVGGEAPEKRVPSLGDIFLAEDFERAGPGALPAGFKVQPGRPGRWEVRDLGGNRALEGEGRGTALVFGRPEWADYEVSLRVRFESAPSALAIIVRHDPASGRNYQLELRPDGAYLVRSLDLKGRDDPNTVKNTGIRPRPGAWHALRVVCRGEVVEFRVDGALAIRSRERLTARGQCKFFLKGRALFDDLKIRRLGR